MEDIQVIVNDDDITDIQAVINGPVGTPYEGGAFRMKLALPQEFPTVPPKGVFLTRIFHPNVSKEGDICVNTLKRDWQPNHGIKHILQIVRCLLIVPFPQSSLNDEAGKMFMEDYDSYVRHAKLMTSIHALPANSSRTTTSSKSPLQVLSTCDTAAPGTPLSPISSNQAAANAANVAVAAAPTAVKPAKKDARKKALRRL